MSKSFELPVWYHGQELFFPAELMQIGYTHKIKIHINETDVLFEPDEERNYRAVVQSADNTKSSNLKPDLLQAIVETLHDLFAD
jgi:hypothetical protein